MSNVLPHSQLLHGEQQLGRPYLTQSLVLWKIDPFREPGRLLLSSMAASCIIWLGKGGRTKPGPLFIPFCRSMAACEQCCLVPPCNCLQACRVVGVSGSQCSTCDIGPKSASIMPGGMPIIPGIAPGGNMPGNMPILPICGPKPSITLNCAGSDATSTSKAAAEIHEIGNPTTVPGGWH